MADAGVGAGVRDADGIGEGSDAATRGPVETSAAKQSPIKDTHMKLRLARTKIPPARVGIRSAFVRVSPQRADVLAVLLGIRQLGPRTVGPGLRGGDLLLGSHSGWMRPPRAATLVYGVMTM